MNMNELEKEQKILKNTPTFEELKECIKECDESIERYKEYISQAPAIMKEQLEKNIEAVRDRRDNYLFAYRMGERGYVLGKYKNQEKIGTVKLPEDELKIALFGEEKNE